VNTKKLTLEEIRVDSFSTGSGEVDEGMANAWEAAGSTRLIKCGTQGGPYCETQKLTGPCGC
jgi:hypothetical protein